MSNPKNSKPVLAEVLVRQVFGEAENFERVCAQRGVSVEDAVTQALRDWVGHGLTIVKNEQPLMNPTIGLLPDPNDCPQGQEAHWIEVCEHDLDALRQKQKSCFRAKDPTELEQTNRTIESYLQTLASLRERVA